MTQTGVPPSPERIFAGIHAFQQSAALKAAIEIGLFSRIAEGKRTASDLAQACDASERGVRILCDYLTVAGFLTKEGQNYGLTPDVEMFLSDQSPAYMGTAIDFLLDPMAIAGYQDLTRVVREGRTALPGEGSVEPDHPIWVKFARAMMPLMACPAQLLAQLAGLDPEREHKILDIASGHGLFGIGFLKQYPKAQVVAVDWAGVLEVAKENAEAAGVSDRYRTLPGSAFEVEFGAGYDVVLLTNILHHFDPDTNEELLKKVHAALADGGKAITLEFIPNEDRVTPPTSAAFSLTMLASTAKGDAYTFPEFEKMLRSAGFTRNELHQLTPSVQQVIISTKE